MQNKLFLIDAYALIFRAYYAFIKNPRVNSKGLNTSAIYGFFVSLNEILEKEKPTHLAVAFDSEAKTFRHDKFPAYKANRDATPEDIKLSVPYIKDILTAMNIPVYSLPGFEADDIIGTLATLASREGFTTYMMTTDKDFCQLVSDNILIYKPAKPGKEAEVWGTAEVKKKFGVATVRQVIDILGLWGDASDNVPGAPGIGEKTAVKLISEYGNIEAILHNASKFQGKIKNTLENFSGQIRLSKELVTIITDIPLSFNHNEMLLTKPDKEKLTQIFNELEFRGISNKLLNYNATPGTGSRQATTLPPVPSSFLQPTLFDMGPAQETIDNKSHYNSITGTEHEYILADSSQKLNELLELLQNSKMFCFDTETTSLDTLDCQLVGISFSVKPFQAFFVPFPANNTDASEKAKLFKEVFENPAIKKTGQNLKFDIMVLNNYNIFVNGPLFDTMIAHYLLQPEQRHNLDYLARTYLNYLAIPIENLIGKKGRNQMSMRLVDINKLKDYSCEDADLALRLKNIFENALKDAGLLELFCEMEMPLVYVLARMEITGVKIDTQILKNYSVILNNELKSIEGEIYSLTSSHFNINSPRQLGDILFNKMKISQDVKLTKSKQFSTSEEELAKLKGKHLVIDKILEYRSVQKLLNTYVDVLPGMINNKTKRIHASFNQAVTATGRLSSSNPNLQNIPIREERSKEIRKAFITSGSDFIFLSADYSQVELRLMAHLSGDPTMTEAFRRNEDIHTATAALIYKIDIADVTPLMRTRAKVANFGIIYGISSFGLSQRLGIPRTEARQLIDRYFETYPVIKNYITDCIALAREKGYVETLFGRKRMLPDINSRNSVVRGFAERNAINAPIQGTAADIIKIAMIRIHREFINNKLKSKLLLQVHDELDFEAHKSELEVVTKIIRAEMENPVKLNVPLVVDIGTGVNWLEAH